MVKNIFIITLLCLCVWMGSRIVVLEKYHYASQLNVCSEYLNPLDIMKREKCLNNQELRIHWIGDLLSGLKIL